MKRPAKKKRPHVSEADVQKTIIDWLTLHRIFFYRNNTGGFFKAGHFYRFGTLGSPDIVCVISGRYVGIEVKDDKGEQSRLQTEFQVGLERSGGKYILARSVEDVILGLDRFGTK